MCALPTKLLFVCLAHKHFYRPWTPGPGWTSGLQADAWSWADTLSQANTWSWRHLILSWRLIPHIPSRKTLSRVIEASHNLWCENLCISPCKVTLEAEYRTFLPTILSWLTRTVKWSWSTFSTSQRILLHFVATTAPKLSTKTCKNSNPFGADFRNINACCIGDGWQTFQGQTLVLLLGPSLDFQRAAKSHGTGLHIYQGQNHKQCCGRVPWSSLALQGQVHRFCTIYKCKTNLSICHKV